MIRQAILAMDRGHQGQLELLEEYFEVIRPQKPDPERTIREHAHEIRAITTFLTPVSRQLIEALPNLEMIAIGAAGLDHIDMKAAKERGIVVTNTPDVLTDDTADVAMMLMLNLARRGVEGDAYIRAGLWHQQGPLPLGRSLSGKTLGIVGLGRIGQAVAKRAKAFNMDVCYFGPREKLDQPYRYYDDLHAMARAVDFMVLTCPGGKETEWLINYEVLEALGPDSMLINIARGSTVKENDLLRALSNRAIAGAGLDVYAHEPQVPEALFTMDNVVLTPHIGSATIETRVQMGKIVVENLLAHFEGRPLLTAV